MSTRAALLGLLALVAACTAAEPTPVCQFDIDCGEGKSCISGACQPKPADMTCGERAPCETWSDCETGVCEDGCCAVTCASDEECDPDMEWCRGGFCREVGSPCLSDNDCVAGSSSPACDVDSGSCVRCLEQAHCDLGELCESRRCVPGAPEGCATDNDCAATPTLPWCFTVSGRCVACRDDGDCPVNNLCDPANHACRPVQQGCGWDGDCVNDARGPRCRQDRACVACLEDDDCPSRHKCKRDNTCTDGPACSSNADCSAPKSKCRTSDLTCVECLNSGDCGSGKTCREGMCLPTTNGCLANQDCSAAKPVCDTATRTCITCRTDAHCGGAFCIDDACVPCEGDLECIERNFLLSRFCLRGACVPCLADRDCSDGLVCLGNQCKPDPIDQPCPVSGVCPRELRCVPNVETGVPTCRAPCDPYDDECPGDRTCAVARFSAGLPVGACEPPVTGASALGGACTETDDCNPGLVCVSDSATTGRCRNMCDPNRSTAACTSPNTCQPYAMFDRSGVPFASGVCFPDSKLGDACARDADCGSAMICGAGPNPRDPYVWGNYCRYAKGTKSTGQGCSNDAECRSGLCLMGMPNGGGAPGFCQGGCTADADCPARADGVPGRCGTFAVPWRDRAGAPATVEVASCVMPCREDAECGTGKFCEVVPNAAKTGFATRCTKSLNTAGARNGGPCRQNSDCRSGECITFGPDGAGICEGACGPSGDSGCHVGATCAPNGVWRRVSNGPDNRENTTDDVFAAAPICWTKTCTANVECGPSRTCAADPDPLNPKDIVLWCHPTQGSRGGGESCSTSGDCKSGLCINWSAGNARCFGACSAAGDCAGGTTCRQMRWTQTQPNKVVSVCAP